MFNTQNERAYSIKLEGMARYAGQLLATAKGLGQGFFTLQKIKG